MAGMLYYYKQKPAKWWEGRRVRLLREVESGRLLLRAGTILPVVGKFKGLTLRSEPCGHCGVSVYITKVPPSAIEFVDPLPDNRSRTGERDYEPYETRRCGHGNALGFCDACTENRKAKT